MSTFSLGSGVQGRSSKMTDHSSKRSAHGSTVGSSSSFATRSRGSTAASKTRSKDKNEVIPKIIDSQGQDVTPKALAPLVSRSTASLASGKISSSGEATSAASEVSSGLITFFSKDIWSTNELISDQIMGEQTFYETIPSPFDKTKRTPSIPTEPQSRFKIDFHKSYVQLEETDTIWIIDIPDTVVTDPLEMEKVKKQNEHYNSVLKRRAGGEDVIHRGIQCLRDPPKNKQTETFEATSLDKTTIASTWLLSDIYQAEEEKEEEKVVEKEQVSAAPSEESFVYLKNIKENLNILERAINLNTYAKVITILKGTESEQTTPEVTYLDGVIDDEDKSEKLQSQEESGRKGTPDTGEEGTDENASSIDDKSAVEDLFHVTRPRMDYLISFSVAFVRENYAVSCMSWNPENEDLFIIAYRLRNFQKSSSLPKGLLYCWCIKNCEYPEKVFTSEFGINCVAFSNSHPSVVAAGMWEGIVAIYDVKSQSQGPLIDNSTLATRPTSAISQIRWTYTTDASGEKNEVFVSVSQDGQVTQWNPHKGLKGTVLMLLSRTPENGEALKYGTNVISKMACGFCIDINKADSNLYIVGTADGRVHECSAVLSDQYLHTYTFHKGPVFQVAWSPFLSDVFLSSSSDWTVAIWERNHSRPLIVIQTNIQKAVLDVTWSTECSTVFSMITESLLEIWDISHSELEPILYCESESEANFTTLAFLPTISGLAVGNDKGKVTLFALKNMPPPQKYQDEVLKNVLSLTT